MAIAQDFSPAGLNSVIEANMQEFWANFGRAPGAELHDEPDLLWFATGTPVAALNGVLRARFRPEEMESRVDMTLAHFGQRKLPLFWHVTPSMRSDELENCLQTQGMRRRPWDPPGMAVDLLAVKEDLPSPAGLTIRPVEDKESLQKWIDVSCSGAPETANVYSGIYGGLGLGPDAPLRHYVGSLNGEPIGVASLFLSAGVASVQLVVTVPQARRQGIGTAMTLATLREARDLGYRIGILTSSKVGYGVYLRLGFQEYCRFRIYELASAL